MSECGADTVPGFHNDPPLIFTEEYQRDFHTDQHRAFDNIFSLIHSDSGYFIGELPRTMPDFGSEQNIVRVGVIVLQFFTQSE